MNLPMTPKVLCILNINIIQYLYLRFTQSLRQGLGVDSLFRKWYRTEEKAKKKKGGIDYWTDYQHQ